MLAELQNKEGPDQTTSGSLLFVEGFLESNLCLKHNTKAALLAFTFL